jgi:hypothetical protein
MVMLMLRHFLPGHRQRHRQRHRYVEGVKHELNHRGNIYVPISISIWRCIYAGRHCRVILALAQQD